MNDLDQRVLEIATRVQAALAACGKCHVIRGVDSSGYVHAVSFQRVVRDPENHYALLVVDVARLPRGVSVDQLREKALVRMIERFLNCSVRVLGGQGVTYVVQLKDEPLQLEAMEFQAA
jgi:hypothetical protein